MFLGICLLLRLPAVLFAHGYEFLDQQFQYVDPAWSLASGDGWIPTWEWIDGIRSWVYPGFLAGIFRVTRAIGVEEPMAMMRVARAVHALISLLPMALLWLALTRWRPLESPRFALLLIAGSGLMVTNGVQTSGPAFGATLAAAAIFAFHGPGWRYPALGGLLLGLAFCCRYQTAIYGPAVVAVGLWQRRWAAVVWFTLACLPGIALQGFVDLAAGRPFFASPWAYLQMNVVLGGAAQWSTRPWWFYLLLGVAPVLVLLPPWLGVAWRRMRDGAVVLPAVFAAATFHVVAHSFVARKALRFEYGAVALLVAVVGVGVAVRLAHESRLGRVYRALLVAAHALLWLWASFFSGHAGAIAAANALREEPSFEGGFAVVHGELTAVGGAFYLRRPRLEVVCMTPEELARAEPPPRWVMAVRTPLAEDVASAAGFELAGEYTGFFDMRRSDRRFLYERRR
ncbi:MAG: hypothetical protein KDE27_28760 [Planctomycetes bacterium]|nr:hypothetical protein [Planctomycetota bacterium]